MLQTEGVKPAARVRFMTLFVVVASAAVALAMTGCGLLRAKGILEDSIDPPEGIAQRLTETRETVAAAGQDVPVRVLRPADASGALPAFVLCHGAAAGGGDDARMLALGRALSVRGATVAIPDLASLRSFRFDTEDPGRIAAVAASIANRADWAQDGRVALFGVSVGGSYALLAAARPELDGRVSALFAFGAYDDLESLLVRWMTVAPDHPEVFDPLTEGRRLVFLGNLDRLAAPQDAGHARAVLDALLAGRAAPDDPPGVAPGTAAMLRAARSDRRLSEEESRVLLAPVIEDVRALSPVPALGPVRFPVHLLHATNDPVVPVGSTTALERHVVADGGDVSVHVTEVFSHVDTQGSPSFLDAFSLLRFFAGFLDDAGM